MTKRQNELNHFAAAMPQTSLAPMFYVITIDTPVTLTALGVIWRMGLV